MMAGALADILDLEDELKGNWIPENFAESSYQPWLLTSKIILCEEKLNFHLKSSLWSFLLTNVLFHILPYKGKSMNSTVL